MDPNEQPDLVPRLSGRPCPLCGARPTWIAGEDATQLVKDFGERHRCTPRVQTRARL